MHIHILGICGTFMGGIAALAKSAGYAVSGSDSNVYPPMSTQLEELGITIHQGYDVDQLEPTPECVVIGNAMSRGNPAVEAVLNSGLPYKSGPQWLAENVLLDRWVLAVSGTHGKTTTASMLAWILEDAGLEPGFLIGGIPANFGLSARFGKSRYFVVEADEYDTAFFDKRAKFVHYRPRTLVINNIEYDHADIYSDMDAIYWQFHQLLRTIPANGRIITNARDDNIGKVIEMGCWTPIETFALDSRADWSAEFEDARQGSVAFAHAASVTRSLAWALTGEHNLENALAAIAAAHHVGVPLERAVDAMSRFKGVKRRLELTANVAGIAIYDDFAHHPTAIRQTIAGLKKRDSDRRLVIALEPRSNTMKMGVHNDTLAGALAEADLVHVFIPAGAAVALGKNLQGLGTAVRLHYTYEDLIDSVIAESRLGDNLIFMSNGGFGGCRQVIAEKLALVNIE
jgi:UDP-N-acetylmuramate: L-alanyl-gamma-D-glutamyl-meso-diaminopimelate ligase